MVSIDEYNEVKDCIYKDEHYSARDNGAVMRHQREGMRVRKDDNVWTFGKPNDKTGYMEIAGQRVHRIVAFAFLGNPPTDQHVVDHIDTNRRNNRPENLRWLTRLENALNNPITRARIENLCGSIEVFLADPSVLRGHERIDPNFSWMRAVSPEEASEFSNMLSLAIEITSSLNNNSASIITDDNIVDSDLQNKEDYLRALSQLSRWFKSYDYMNVIDWLEYKG